MAPTSLTVTQNDTGLRSFKWHSDLSGKLQKWYKENEGCAVQLPTAALLWNSQLLLCSIVLAWQSTLSLDLWTTGTVLQGWLAAGDILSHEGWDRKQPFPGAFLWDSWPCQCHIMLLGTIQRKEATIKPTLTGLRQLGLENSHVANAEGSW